MSVATTAEPESAAWRALALRRMAGWALLLGVGMALLTTTLVVTHDASRLQSPQFLLMMLAYGSLVPVRWASMSYPTRAVLFVLAMGTMGVFSLMAFGFAPGPLMLLCATAVSAGVFLGRRALLVTLALAAAAIVASGYLLTRGYVHLVTPPFLASVMFDWVRAAVEFTLVAGSVAVLVIVLTTELERQDLRLAERARLEALGRLAGGVAHDFNNALQVIFVWNELLREHAHGEVLDGLDEIQGAAEQARRQTARLLAVGRRDVVTPEDLDLGVEVETWVNAMRRLVPEDIALELRAKGSPWIHCDKGQLEQILLNFVVNARDAIAGPGRIELVIDEIDAALVPNRTFSTAKVARLVVRDDGPGIPPEILHRVFEPFFTTKGDRGTGLGLSIVYGAVERAGGHLDVTSVPGKTEFTLWFPSVPAVQPAEAADASSLGDLDCVVLLAEDEPSIRRSMAKALRASGCTVLEAEDGTAAAAIIAEKPGAIDVLCTDGVMPGLSTRELIARYLAANPKGRVIVCSGHVEEELLRRELDESKFQTLPKPFKPSALIARIDRLRRAA